jgi:hypothetical protein
VALLAASGSAVLSAVLWHLHPHLPQHAATLVSLLVVAGTGTYLVTQSDTLPGVGLWAVGAVWAVLAWGGVIRDPRQGMILGAIATVFASILIVNDDWGAIMAVLTLAVLVTVAVASRDLIMLAVASIGALVVLPATMNRLFPGTPSAALGLLAIGALLVIAAIVTARRRRGRPAGAAGHDWSRGTTRAAITVAALIAIASTSAIIVAAVR